MANENGEQIRIIQETVAGKEITFAHVMGGPDPIIYQKLGLNPQVDYSSPGVYPVVYTLNVSDKEKETEKLGSVTMYVEVRE